MTTKLDLYERLLDRFVAHASENKWPLAATLPEHRKKLGTAAIVTEIEVRCGPPFDAGVLPDYIDKEVLSAKALWRLHHPEDTSDATKAAMAWNPSASDKAFLVDLITKVLRVIRA